MNHQLTTYTSLIGMVFLLFFTDSNGQEYRPAISNLSVNNGLSQSTIIDMVHDENGFLWIATQDGLNKYDGYTFKIFKSSPDNPATISNSFVKCLELDSLGNLWIGTQAGLTIYDAKKETFNRHLGDSEKAFGSNTINGILFFDESVWLATEEGLLVSGAQDRLAFKPFTPSSGVANDFQIEELAVDRFGNIWLASSKGLHLVNSEKELIKVELSGLNVPISYVEYIRDKVWVGTEKGLWTIDVESSNTLHPEKITRYPLDGSDCSVTAIHHDHHNNIWVGTESHGVLQVDLKYSTLKPYLPLAGMLNNSSINTIFEDLTHNVWVGTIETGLYKIIGSTKNFGLLRSEPGDYGLTSNIVRGIFKHNEEVWLGTSRGLNGYNRETMEFQSYTHSQTNPESISNNDVKVIEMSEDGFLWVGTDDGLNRFNRSTGTFERFLADDDQALTRSDRIRTINTLSDGYLWVGSLGGGISVIDPITKKLVKSYFSDNAGKNKVMDIFEDSRGVKWAASYGAGLCRLNPETDRFEEVLPQAGLPMLLTSIHEDEKGMLWIGSYGDGLINLNPDDLSYTLYTMSDGLSNNVVYAAIPFGNELWISTNYGLSRLDLESGTFSSFNENDGLQSNEFNTASYFKCVTGELFFGGVNGLTFFFPDSIKSSSEAPKLAFTDFRIFNQSIQPDEVVIDGDPPLTEGIRDSAQVNLEHFHNSFTIAFSSLDFSNPVDSRYAYQLEGFDKDWIYSDASQRDITYTNLEPGSYTFMMKATNGDGYWNEEPIRLFINVAPSIWQSSWFRTLLVLTGASLIGLFVYTRIDKVERRRKILEEKIKEHTREISDQNELLRKSENTLINENRKKDQIFYILAHNVRAPLTTFVAFLRSIDGLSADQIKSFSNDLNKQVSDSLLLLDNSFYWSIIQFGKLQSHPEPLDLNSIVSETARKFERSALTKGIVLNHQTSAHPQVTTDKQLLSTIIQNLISNAIKYSPENGKINISIVDRDPFLELIVEDYGKGLKEEDLQNLFSLDRSFNELGSRKEKGTGLGLIVSSKLADHLGCKLKVDSQEGAYTRFWVEIPYR